MMGMLFFTLAIHQYVIKVDNNELANEGLEDLVHKPHKSTWCICQPEWHHKPLIETSFGFEGRLPLISFIDPDLIIATSKINLRKYGGSMKLI